MTESFARTIRDHDLPEPHWLAEVLALSPSPGLTIQLPEWTRNNMAWLEPSQARELGEALIEAAEWQEARQPNRWAGATRAAA